MRIARGRGRRIGKVRYPTQRFIIGHLNGLDREMKTTAELREFYGWSRDVWQIIKKDLEDFGLLCRFEAEFPAPRGGVCAVGGKKPEDGVRRLAFRFRCAAVCYVNETRGLDIGMLFDILERRIEIRSAVSVGLELRRMELIEGIVLLDVLNLGIALDDRKLVIPEGIQERIELRKELRQVRCRAPARIDRHRRPQAFLARTLQIKSL